ncbi:MAG: transcriptional regulator [marine bacterium B5-7]|nr:MAG: transcriptional regulator [marine bacterium B5-7]
MGDLIQQLQQLRKQQGISQQSLSQRLRIPQSHISKIESAKTDVRLSTLQEFAHAMGYEVMLVPRILERGITAIINGEDTRQPLWQLDEDDDDA